MSSETDGTRAWFDQLASMNEEFLASYREALDAQTRLVQNWTMAMESTTEQPVLTEGLMGSLRATEALVDGAQTSLRQVGNVAEGEPLQFEDARDIWLNAANEAMKELMRTSAFAQASGQTVEGAMDLREQRSELLEATLRAWGLPTDADVGEVGERLVELERRQHAVEQELERLADGLEAGE